MTDIPLDSVEPTLPFPPRRRWLMRSSWGLLVLAILMLGTRFWWGWEADRRLQERVELYASRGEPVRIADFNREDPPADGRNAAKYYLRAIAARSQTAKPPGESWEFTTEYPPYPPSWHRMVQAAYAANTQALQLMRAARAYDDADWGIRYQSPAINYVSPYNASRSLAILTADCALYEHFNGNDAQALERIRDVRHLGKIVDRQPFIISHLVAIGIDALALTNLEIIASGISLADEEGLSNKGNPTTHPAAGPATREQLRVLIGELLADSNKSEALQASIKTERTAAIDTAAWRSSKLWLVRPLAVMDEVRLADQHEEILRAARHPDANTAKSVKESQKESSGPRSARFLSNTFTMNCDRIIQQEAHIIAERRMAAVSLAAQLYKIDHEGEWPASLEALVPRYFPDVPEDPEVTTRFATLGYLLVPHGRPDGADRPLVYHAGENGKDDTAEAAGKGMALVPAEPCFSWQSRTLDQWRDLSSWAPPPGSRQLTGLPLPAPEEEGSSDSSADKDSGDTTQPTTAASPDSVEAGDQQPEVPNHKR